MEKLSTLRKRKIKIKMSVEKQSPLMDLKPFTPRPNYQNSIRIYIASEKKEPEVQMACNGAHFSQKKDFVFKTPKKHVAFTDEDIKQWVIFMNECGFPCSYEETKTHIMVFINHKEYENHTHYKCGITAIRYPFYGYSPQYKDIAEKTIALYLEEKDKITPHEALCKAHGLVAAKGYFDTGHSLNSNCPIITKEQMLEKTKTKNSVNSVYE